ncbi:MAG: hypothetical protein RLY91_1966, partial [Pseudomonadota bacterium]
RQFQLADVNSCIRLEGVLGFSIILDGQALAAGIESDSSAQRDGLVALLRVAHASIAHEA